MCRGLNLAFKECACAVRREGVCLFCEEASATAMISTIECSIKILSLSFSLSGIKMPRHPKINFTSRHGALFCLCVNVLAAYNTPVDLHVVRAMIG